MCLDSTQYWLSGGVQHINANPHSINEYKLYFYDLTKTVLFLAWWIYQGKSER